MLREITKVLVEEKALRTRVAELGAQISREYAHTGRRLLLIGILRGSIVFFSDLIREIEHPNLLIDFMSISSYGVSNRTSGEVRMLKDLDESLEGTDAIIVEDIVDTGLTLQFLKKVLLSRNPASLKVCCLLDKPERRQVDLAVDYVGFSIPNEFVVGYGLDYAQKYRNLKYIGVLDPSLQA